MAFIFSLPNIVGKAAELFASDSVNMQFKSHTEAINLVRQKQTAGIGQFGLADNNKDTTVQIAWLNACAVVDQACSDDCVQNSIELTDDSKTYTLTLCREAPFSFTKKTLRSKIWSEEEVIAVGLNKAIASLDTYWTKMVYTKLQTFLGVNAYSSSKWAAAVAPNRSEVTVANTNINLIPELIIAGAINKFSAPWYLSGSLLFSDYWVADRKNVPADGQGGQGIKNIYDGLDINFDIFHADAVSGAKWIYQINNGALAHVTKAYYEGGPEESKVDMRFSVPSNNIPGVIYDVIMKEVCVSNDIKLSFVVQTKGDILLNPTGCVPTNTGVIGYKQIP